MSQMISSMGKGIMSGEGIAGGLAHQISPTLGKIYDVGTMIAAPFALGSLGGAGTGAGGMVPMSSIGSAGGLSAGDLSTALSSNPALAGIDPSMVTGASAPMPAATGGGFGSAASTIANSPLTNTLLGGMMNKSQPPPPPQAIPLTRTQGTPVAPITVPAVGIRGPIGQQLPPAILALLSRLSPGGMG